MKAIRWRAERSYRRSLLDRDLGAIGSYLRGNVLEIGAGRAGRRGTFRPPMRGVERWLTLDRAVATRPDIAADVAALPIRASSLDTVVCLEVLEYVTDPVAALAEMRRALRPGGHLVLSVPFLHRQDADDDLWRPTEAGLRRWVAGAGLRIVEMHRQGGALASAANVLKHAAWNGGPVWARALSIGLLAPLAALLSRLDGDPHEGSRATFSTGHLAVARREP